MITLALNSLIIQSVPYQDDTEMDRLITLLLSCKCILRGPFDLTQEQKSCFEERLAAIASMHPKSSSISDYPKAIEFWGILEKIRSDFFSKMPEENISHIIDDPVDPVDPTDPTDPANLVDSTLLSVCCYFSFSLHYK